jgi:hypothetical protein
VQNKAYSISANAPSFEAVVVFLLTIIIALIGVLYWGLVSRVNTLDISYRDAAHYGERIKDLLVKSPTLEHDIAGLRYDMDLLKPVETHDAIVALKTVPEQLIEIKKQLDNMQSQTRHSGK